ncbi:MAG TPA: leucine/isoleucine/valine transporter permease subunit [Acidimicrobiia bacterium]|nr:leucine/isoleucine/valine transporter permease subunit [Acidimicrobiia bacterium]
MRRAVKLGLAGGAAMVLVAAIGMVAAFQARMLIDPILPLGTFFLYLVAFIFGWMASKPPVTLEGFEPARAGIRNVLAGAMAGALGGLCVGLLLIVMTTWDLRGVFIALSPELAEILSFGLPVAAAIPVIALVAGAAGALGGAVHLLSPRLRRAVLSALAWVLVFSLFTDIFGQAFTALRLEFLVDFIYTGRGGALTIVGAIVVFAVFFVLYWWMSGRTNTLRQRVQSMPRGQRSRWQIGAAVIILVVLYFVPKIMGPFVSQILVTAGIYLLMALGLNIVVGYAGLLDLGYVAFFAVGAYTTAILTSPQSPAFSPELSVVASIPFVMIAAAVAGILVATPVIRMRGDYLAIVTLGFGEIARILLNSEWLAPYFGGAQGITNIPDLQIGPLTFSTPQDYFYPVFLFVLFAAYVTYALQNSRWGRAWMAMREDESVAEAMGVNIVTAKLSAFVVGAILASFGGSLFASQIGSVFPHTFDIVVSITVLVIIIVGGMGSVPGVALGAIVLIVLPNLLREFSEYQFLFYGVLLIVMMLNRPEGFIPSKRRAQELHSEEMAQDAWLEIYGEKGQPEQVPEGAV